MAALLPTLEPVAAPIPAPAAPPTVAPVKVPQPATPKVISERPKSQIPNSLFNRIAIGNLLLEEKVQISFLKGKPELRYEKIRVWDRPP
jgi:hypothetical protein